MDKKYFFFDYDGTLTDRRSNTLMPSSIEAVKKLQDNGHFVALCTGRAYYKAKPVMENLGIHNMVCCGGGGLVIDDVLIKNNPLNNNDAKDLLRFAVKNNIGYLCQLKDSIDAYSNNNLFNDQTGGRREPTELHIDPDFDFEKCDYILKLYLAVPKEKVNILPTFDGIGYLAVAPNYVVVQYDRKDRGIIEMMNYLKAPIKDAVVFGDDDNDVVMFRPEWTSIALGNGTDELKAKATYVTDNSYDDGVYNACKKFGWIG